MDTLYAGIQDCMQVSRTVWRYAGLYAGMQDYIQVCRTVWSR